MEFVVLVTVGLLIAGALIGRTWVLLVPAFLWPLYFLWAYSGVTAESPASIIALLIVTYIVLGVAAVGLGLYLRRFVVRLRK
jgi:hypothetical protein